MTSIIDPISMHWCRELLQCNLPETQPKHESLEALSSELANTWRQETGHYWGSTQGLSCKIYQACQDATLHVGFACSLARNGNEIARFLESGKHFGRLHFARLLLFQLDEFVDGMAKISCTAGLPSIASPPMLSRWANWWAKHRVAVDLQHHPLEILEDFMYTNVIDSLPADGTTEILAGAESKSYRLIRTHNLDLLGKSRLGCDSAKPASHAPFMVVIPKLCLFLDETIASYRLFVKNCVANPDLVREYSVPKSDVWTH